MSPEAWIGLASIILVVLVALIGLVYKLLDREILALRKWKHERGEPYIGAMDAMNKRVERLERKVFNGHRRDHDE